MDEEYKIVYTRSLAGKRVPEIWSGTRKVCVVPEDRDEEAFEKMIERANLGAAHEDDWDGEDDEED